MNTLIQQFTNRELALITWLFIFLILLLFLKPFRNFIKSIIDILFKKDFLIIYFLFFGYLSLIVYILSLIGLWDLSHIIDLIFWIVGVGLLLVFSGIKHEDGYFRKVLLESLKYTLIVEFIINLHVFGYIIELFLLPFIVFIGLINAISENDAKYKSVQSCSGYILAIFGLGILSFVLFKTIQNFRVDFSYDNLQSLLLPSALTILFIPFSYLVAVYSAYNVIFARITHLRNLKYSIRFLKRSIVKTGKLNLSRIKRIQQRLNQFDLNETNNISEYLSKIAK
jgi:hypothetical protein